MLTFKELRIRAQLSQAELAHQAGMRQASISAIENGQTQPQKSTREKLASALNCTPDELQQALRTQTHDPQLGNEAISQFSKDWPFLAGLDSDLRKGLATSLVADWTHSSTALEGNTITLGDTLFVLTEGLTVSGKSLREHQEIHGHSQALALLANYTRSQKPLTISQLHELHRAVQTGAVIDAFAPIGKWKVEPNGTTAITSQGTSQWHDYAHPRDTPFLIQDFLQLTTKAQQTLPPFSPNSQNTTSIVSAYTSVHLAFVAIHPYADGNGRLARLLANLPLLRAGWPPLLIPSNERRNYLTLLGDYSLSRGKPKQGEELNFSNPQFNAAQDFFQDCCQSSFNSLQSFHQKQQERNANATN